MPAKTTLNAANLKTLGAARLAALVLALVEGDAAAKRRVRLEFAGRHDAGELARAVRKRLQTVARAGSALDTDGQRALARDLDGHRRALMEHLAARAPDEAFDLVFRLMELRPALLDRCHWRGDDLVALFDDAAADLAGLVATARPPAGPLAERLARLVEADTWNGGLDVLEAIAPRLDDAGRKRLRTTLEATLAERAGRRARPTIVRALARLADLAGDVDAYVALFDEEQRRAPAVAAEIAQRLLEAGRVDAAAAALALAPAGERRWPERDRVAADVIEASGDVEGAQARRWDDFAATLDPDHQKAYLARLPDFDDVEAEKRAFAHARAFPRVHAGLAFLLAWPAPREAAKLVVTRAEELDGDRWELLSPAAETLGERHPLAATLLRRALIEATLTRKRTTRYGHAARHWRACAELAGRIGDFERFESHDDFSRRIEATHGRKLGFWARVAER